MKTLSAILLVLATPMALAEEPTHVERSMISVVNLACSRMSGKTGFVEQPYLMGFSRISLSGHELILDPEGEAMKFISRKPL